MSLDKGIMHNKEHRKEYHGTKVFDKTCRNHGSCSWCTENRLHKFRDKGKNIAIKTNDVMNESL